MGGVESGPFSRNGPGQHFGVSLESICIEVRVAGEHAACCGVNLAFGGFWWFWFGVLPG